jgi:predicted acylesterase/phospholipase RssA
MSRCVLGAEAQTDTRRALLLAGGGMRVAWQVGALLALERAGLRFQHLDGASGGTINLSMLLCGLSPAEMAERWRSLAVKDFVSLMPITDYLHKDWPAMADGGGLRDKVFPHLGIDAGAVARCEGVSATFNVCNATRKTLESIPHGEVDEDLLVAAISLPGMMPGVPWRGGTYLDAVWIKDTNLWEAVRRGAEELWLLWCIGNAPVYHDGVFRQYVHMIEMSANGALFEELDRIRELNARISRGDSPYGQRKPITLHVIKPDQAIPLDPDFYFGRIDAGSLIALGNAAASGYLVRRDPAGLPLNEQVTVMTDASAALGFRESMSGPFSMGATDPATVGEHGDFTAAMHAQVYIPDMAAFIVDPSHSGVLSGTLDLPPLGMQILCPAGVFRLFSPTDRPDTKYMVYELAFDHGGKSYYLAGHKVVRNGPAFDLWHDTTTLYTVLHEGRDTIGPVAGAGTLRLGTVELMKLLSTLEVTNSSGPVQRMEIIGQFGRFFLGRLWDTYVRHVKA